MSNITFRFSRPFHFCHVINNDGGGKCNVILNSRLIGKVQETLVALSLNNDMNLNIAMGCGRLLLKVSRSHSKICST